MAEVSRTARVIQNAKVALFFYCINLILQFFSRKIFLDYLGAELLGLNTTAQNLLQFLNLAESGIGAAVAFALYKPLSQKNRQEIIDIVSLQGWFYRWVGLLVIAGSVVLMAFFPWIFAKADVPLIYAYGTFIAFLISALLGYFVNYKMIVLSADQKEYKITIETQSIKIIKVLIQMLAIWKLPHGYVCWMVLEVLAAVLTSIRLHFSVKKEYPWLVPQVSKGNTLKKQYSFILVKTKQLFFHRIGGYVLGQTTPLVIYAFTTLTVVAIYGNYLILMGGCLMLTDAFFRGFNASVGNLISEGDRKIIKKTFWEVLTLRLFLAGLICFGIYSLSDQFMILWLGKDYVMPVFPLFLMTSIYFVQMSRTCDVFLWGYGLFQDIWAPVLESLLNLGFAIIFGAYWGLSGILMGVLFSQIVVVNTWKPYFLYREGFRESFVQYVLLHTKKMFLLLIVLLLAYFTLQHFLLEVESYIAWLQQAIITSLVYLILGGGIFYIFDDDFRSVLYRVVKSVRIRSNL